MDAGGVDGKAQKEEGREMGVAAAMLFAEHFPPGKKKAAEAEVSQEKTSFQVDLR